MVGESKPSDGAIETGPSDARDPWQRTVSMALQLHTLEVRVEELEKDLEDAEMGARCRNCHAYALQYVDTRGPYNGEMMEERWRCASCAYQESRIYALPDERSLISGSGA